jgi:hypothetical protein
MKRWLLSSALAAALAVPALAPSVASAGLPGTTQDAVHYEYEEELCNFATDWDSGWVGITEISVRFQFHIGCSFYASMDGFGVLNWPPSMDLSFEGTPNTGKFGQDLGLTFEGRLKIDIDVDVFDIEWEGPIPFIPTLDYGFFDEKTFDPFLLAGNPERPVYLMGDTGRYELLSLNILDFIGIPEDIASLELSIEMSGQLNSFFGGMRIETSDHNRAIYEEGQKLRVNPPGEPQYEVDATYYGMVSHELILFFYLTARIELIGGLFDWEFDLLTVPVEVFENTETWQFNTESLVFYLPDIEVADTEYNTLTEIRFPPTQVGFPRTMHFLVINMGYEDLEGTVTTSEPFLVRPEDFTLAPGDEAEFNILFSPEGAGDIYGVVRIESNDPDEGDIDIPIFATGTFHEVEDIPDSDAAPEGDGTPWINYGYQDSCGCTLVGDEHARDLLALLALALLGSVLAVVRRKRLP